MIYSKKISYEYIFPLVINLIDKNSYVIHAGDVGNIDIINNLKDSCMGVFAVNGNNDDAVTDWIGIPEFTTLLAPIASVLLIVGYNYRKRETLED